MSETEQPIVQDDCFDPKLIVLLEAAKAVHVEHDTIAGLIRSESGRVYSVGRHDDKHCRACALNNAIAQVEGSP